MELGGTLRRGSAAARCRFRRFSAVDLCRLIVTINPDRARPRELASRNRARARVNALASRCILHREFFFPRARARGFRNSASLRCN